MSQLLSQLRGPNTQPRRAGIQPRPGAPGPRRPQLQGPLGKDLPAWMRPGGAGYDVNNPAHVQSQQNQQQTFQANVAANRERDAREQAIAEAQQAQMAQWNNNPGAPDAVQQAYIDMNRAGGLVAQQRQQQAQTDWSRDPATGAWQNIPVQQAYNAPPLADVGAARQRYEQLLLAKSPLLSALR